ncbi:hypothetical protein F5Y19DRAFT_283182 [Xylariaceae sp. FL1651]|nr:hypothetical protein F5Y19DRAFT_283182 [Xylariaceae sp. FL1651]
MALPFPTPASLSSSFTISRPTKDDIHDMSQVYYESFQTDPGNTYWWSPDQDAMFDWLRMRVQRKMADRSVRHFQVVDSSSPGQREIVAWARWDIPNGYEDRFGEWVGEEHAVDVSRIMKDEKESEKGAGQPVTAAPIEEATPSTAKTIDYPRGADPALCRDFFALLSTLSEKWNAKEMLGLSLLCTSPKYQRRGAAKALLLPMLEIADAVGLRTYLEATPGGRPIYEKLGFRTVELKEFDLTALTRGRLSGIYKLSIMIREPQPI